jgi:isocitrate dehydrogenase
MDLVIVRENEEDLYAGIEYQQTDDVTQCLKLISRSGSNRIIQYAFQYALGSGRKKVSCMSKDNIMKLTDGLFHRCFTEIAAQYPHIKTDHWIIDIGAARIATRPSNFDVIVTLNLYGDIISDIAAEVTGSVGLAGSANIGAHHAMFEAIHGSAPDIAGQGIANPSGMLLGAVMMLSHIGLHDYARRIHDAWLCCLEEGIHTKDIANQYSTKQIVGTEDFSKAVVEALGKEPSVLNSKRLSKSGVVAPIVLSQEIDVQPAVKQFEGIDIFIDERQLHAEALAERFATLKYGALHLEAITNRGIQVWPQGLPNIVCSDHWRCRFVLKGQGKAVVVAEEISALLLSISKLDLDVVKTENLYSFDGKNQFSVA